MIAEAVELLALIDGMIENTEEVIAQDSITPDHDPDGYFEALAAYRLTRDDVALVLGFDDDDDDE